MIKGFKRLITIALCSAIGAGLGGCSGGASDSIASGQGAAGVSGLGRVDHGDDVVADLHGLLLQTLHILLGKVVVVHQKSVLSFGGGRRSRTAPPLMALVYGGGQKKSNPDL